MRLRKVLFETEVPGMFLGAGLTISGQSACRQATSPEKVEPSAAVGRAVSISGFREEAEVRKWRILTVRWGGPGPSLSG
jgi:hypothetical protein